MIGSGERERLCLCDGQSGNRISGCLPLPFFTDAVAGEENATSHHTYISLALIRWIARYLTRAGSRSEAMYRTGALICTEQAGVFSLLAGG